MSDKAKQAAAALAASWIEGGMIVGLGSGSTAYCFIQSLIERCRKGLLIEAVASSQASFDLAQKGGLDLIDFNAAPRVDITVDGADEIDEKKRMIKGGGGAHVREKILASSSKEMVVIVDSTKVVSKLGKRKLPVEILYYGSFATRAKIENLGLQGSWRMSGDTFYISENGNLIFDITFPSLPSQMEELHEQICQIPGVIDTGFFSNLAGRVIVGYPDGTTKIWKE